MLPDSSRSPVFIALLVVWLLPRQFGFSGEKSLFTASSVFVGDVFCDSWLIFVWLFVVGDVETPERGISISVDGKTGSWGVSFGSWLILVLGFVLAGDVGTSELDIFVSLNAKKEHSCGSGLYILLTLLRRRFRNADEGIKKVSLGISHSSAKLVRRREWSLKVETIEEGKWMNVSMRLTDPYI